MQAQIGQLYKRHIDNSLWLCTGTLGYADQVVLMNLRTLTERTLYATSLYYHYEELFP